MIRKATKVTFLVAMTLAACGGSKPANAPHCDPAVAGQMTETAALGKRKFDGGEWAEAAKVLGWVADGKTGDDQGNRQLAAYHRGIALYRAGQQAEGRAQLEAIATTTCHLKQKDAEAWLRDPESAAKK